MKALRFFLLVFLFFTAGCDLREREKELEILKAELNEKEQQLLLKEKTLQLKEEELATREKKLDSSLLRLDSNFVYDSVLMGQWSVKMVCTETTCAGSAVGDTRTEQWQFLYEGQDLIAKAFSENKLIRVYSGTAINGVIELHANREEANTQQITRMTVHLQKTTNNQMGGRREIIRPENCRVVYSLHMVKQ